MFKIDIHNYVVIPTAVVSSIIAILTILIAAYIMSHFVKANKQNENTIMTMNATPHPSRESKDSKDSKTKYNSKKTQKQKKVEKHSSDSDVGHYFRYSSIVLVLGNATCSFFNAVYCIYLVFDPYHDDQMFYTSHYSHFLRIISTISWYIGTIAIVWFFNGRLYYAFKGSLFSYSKRIFRATNVFVTLMGILSVVVAYWAVYFQLLIVAEFAFNSFRIAYQIITFLLLFMFSRRLLFLTAFDKFQASTNLIDVPKNLTETKTPTNTNSIIKTPSRANMSEVHVHPYKSDDDTTNGKSPTNSPRVSAKAIKHRIKFLDVTAKNAVLVSVTSTSVFLVTFFWFSFRFIFLPQTRLTLLIPMNMASIDALINSICCIMLFRFGKPLNDKLCHCCNQCFINICIVCAKNYAN